MFHFYDFSLYNLTPLEMITIYWYQIVIQSVQSSITRGDQVELLKMVDESYAPLIWELMFMKSKNEILVSYW